MSAQERKEAPYLRARLREMPGAEESFDDLLNKGRARLEGLSTEQLRSRLMSLTQDPEHLSEPAREVIARDREAIRTVDREQLIEKLCEFWSDQLAGLLVILTDESKILRATAIFSKRTDETQPVVPIKESIREESQIPKEIPRRPLDDWETATEGFARPEEIKRLQQKLKTAEKSLQGLARDLQKLHSSRVVRYSRYSEATLEPTQELPGRLRRCAQLIEQELDSFFRPLLERLKATGPQARPDYNRQFLNLVNLVQRFTGDPQFTQLANIISALSQDEAVSTESLRDRYNRHRRV